GLRSAKLVTPISIVTSLRAARAPARSDLLGGIQRPRERVVGDLLPPRLAADEVRTVAVLLARDEAGVVEARVRLLRRRRHRVAGFFSTGNVPRIVFSGSSFTPLTGTELIATPALPSPRSSRICVSPPPIE